MERVARLSSWTQLCFPAPPTPAPTPVGALGRATQSCAAFDGLVLSRMAILPGLERRTRRHVSRAECLRTYEHVLKSSRTRRCEPRPRPLRPRHLPRSHGHSPLHFSFCALSSLDRQLREMVSALLGTLSAVCRTLPKHLPHEQMIYCTHLSTRLSQPAVAGGQGLRLDSWILHPLGRNQGAAMAALVSWASV